MAIALTRNSTNVRDNPPTPESPGTGPATIVQEAAPRPERPAQDNGRVIAVALTFFGALFALGVANGVFARLSPSTLAALAVFALGFPALAVALDAQLRAYLRGCLPRPRRFRKARATSPGGSRAAT